MLWLVKEKSWSVRLVDGFILNNQVRAKQCKDCTGTTEFIVSNYGDPNLLLFGCSNHKCQHRLIRIRVAPEPENQITLKTENPILIQNLTP